MGSKYELFDRSRLKLKPLAERINDLDISIIKNTAPYDGPIDEGLRQTALAMLKAKKNKAPVIFMMGAHVIRSGVQNYLIDLMENGFINALAGNGACAIHDYELARIGATTESVAKYISEGQFGLWQELAELNEALTEGVNQGLGAGESIGKLIFNDPFPYKNISLLAAAYRLDIPFTLHIGIGSDILHQQPNCDGAILGKASYTDFLILAKIMEKLENGVFANFGSAVAGPEVYLKALAMVRNVAGGITGGPRYFTTLVCDLHDLPSRPDLEAGREEPLYFYRPWKTILVRTVSDGGQSFYVKARHAESIPALWTAIKKLEKEI